MSIFKHLMREPIPYRVLKGTSSTGTRLYEPPRNEPPAILYGRLEWQRKKVISDRGDEAISEAALFTETRLHPGDLVIVEGKDWPVTTVYERKGLYGGKTDHWEVRL